MRGFAITPDLVKRVDLEPAAALGHSIAKIHPLDQIPA